MSRLLGHITRLVVLLLVSSVGLVALTTTSASAATRCDKNSGSYAGRCFKSLRVTTPRTVVDAVPLVNDTRKGGTFHCSFTRTITRSVKWGGSLSLSAKATVFKVVEASATATVSREVTQTGSQATSAGASFFLKPGQKVVCQRTYGFVRTRVKQYEYRGTQTVNVRYFTVRTPSYLGVRVVD